MKKWKTSGRARLIVAAAAVGVFASLAGVGYGAGLVHFAHSSATDAQYPPSKVTICHHTHSQKNPFVTITVSVHALPAHLRHGDTVGACSQGPTGPTGPTGAQGVLPTKVIVAKHLNHGHHGDKSHGNSAKGPAGKSHGSQGQGQGKTHGQSKSKTHGHQGHGQGQNHGQGHGGGNGNSGGGKGNGHKP